MHLHLAIYPHVMTLKVAYTYMCSVNVTGKDSSVIKVVVSNKTTNIITIKILDRCLTKRTQNFFSEVGNSYRNQRSLQKINIL